MSILKRSILQPGATFIMIAGMMTMGIFAMNSIAAVAATPCDPGTSLGGPGNPPNCDVAITTSTLMASGGLSFTTDSTITQQAVVVGANNFTFAATVTDTRNTTAGWQLQASSAGLSTGTGHPALQMTIGLAASTAICTPTDGGPAGANCPSPAIAPIPLGTTPTTFVTETPTRISPDNLNPISGVVTLGISGSYNVPVGTYPGTYTGAITLSLLDTYAS